MKTVRSSYLCVMAKNQKKKKIYAVVQRCYIRKVLLKTMQ